MLIAKSAVRAFLSRELRDSNYLKDYAPRELERKTDRLAPRPSFHTTPRAHQRACFLLGLKYRAYLFLLDMGLGKSKVALDLVAHLQRHEDLGPALVLVPNTTNVQQWIDEVKVHAPRLRVAGLDAATREARLEALDSGADLVVCTYMGWISLVCEKTKSKRKKGGKLQPSKKLFKKYGSRFGAVVYDEINAAQNSRSLTFRCCNVLSNHCAVRFGLTGTIMGVDPEALWAQFYLVDRGATLGPTLGLFRAGFFNAKKSFWHQGYEYSFDKKKGKLLNRTMRHQSVRYSEDECLDLPRRVEITNRVAFPPETWAYYEKVLDEMRKAQGNYQLMENAFMRARQMCSGFATAKGEDGTKIDVKFGQNPKLDALLQKLSEVPPGRKAIIFHELIASGQIVADALKKAKVRFVWLHGKARKKSELVRAFQTDKKVRVMLSSTAGARGGNWQQANYVFFYEIPLDVKLYWQMLKRAHRQGQARTVFVTRFIVRNSVEEKLRAAHKAGKDLFAELVDGKVKL